MRLISVDIRGYKRFADHVTLKVDGDVTALVGPNEAGKTTILDALLQMNDDEPFAASEITRGFKPHDDDFIVRLDFLLDDEDRSALADIAEAADVRWYHLSKAANGRYWFDFAPAVSRDKKNRARIASVLKKAAGNPALHTGLFSSDEELTAEDAVELARELATTDGELEAALITRLRALATILEEADLTKRPKYLQQLPAALAALVDSEGGAPPEEQAHDLLLERVPQFLMFGDNERTLANSYDLTQLSQPFPAALVNLAEVGKLDLDALIGAVRDDRMGEVHEIRDRANQELRTFFDRHWKQSQLTVELVMSGADLELYIRELTGSYWRLEERSEGLRWFVALVSYLHAEAPESPPILLIDEAEQHLHYDGQADVVRAFERQDAVADVIYTTHSAGCLPQDLGTGVRVVVRKEGVSGIQNSLWADSDLRIGAGLSSLLMAMGASTFAFAATRRALICEGVTEAALLPTLLREAAKISTLDFQIVPGLANVAGNSVMHLDMTAVHVGFLVDSDDAGIAIAKKLRRARVDSGRILKLTRKNRTLEDLVDAKQLRRAIHEEFERSGILAKMPASAVSKHPRIKSAESWCTDQTPRIKLPNKLAIAQRLLSYARTGEQIVNARSIGELTALHESASALFDPSN
jgi:predicted ATP-dependent endonuclease of OLD family